MTPNFEHFRTILLELQSLDNPTQFRGIAEIPNEETNGYLQLLEDKGLIEGRLFEDKEGGHYIVSRITLKGYEFLEGISDESKWQEAKKSVVYMELFSLLIYSNALMLHEYFSRTLHVLQKVGIASQYPPTTVVIL